MQTRTRKEEVKRYHSRPPADDGSIDGRVPLGPAGPRELPKNESQFTAGERDIIRRVERWRALRRIGRRILVIASVIIIALAVTVLLLEFIHHNIHPIWR